eukprot:gene8247-71_t
MKEVFNANFEKSTDETKHLYLTNISNLINLKEILQDLNVVEFVDKKNFLYLSFESVEDSKKAKEFLKKPNEKLENRNLIVEFSKPKLKKEKKLNIECTSKTEYLKIPGLTIIENFITKDQEEALINEIDSKKWSTNIKRRVQHFGYEFNYLNNNIDVTNKIGDLPSYCNDFYFKDRVDQLTINEYEPGIGIKPHIDTHSAFEDGLHIISLESDIVMLFQKEDVHKNVIIPRRSLLIMEKECRYAWRHCIWYRKQDVINGKLVNRKRRISLTFRKVRGHPCTCEFPEYCDSQEDFNPTEIEKKNVHDVYDEIARHWDHTRHTPWKYVQEFLSQLPKNSFIADVGCGNGKYFNLINKNSYIIGIDRSENLIEICNEKYPNVESFVSDASILPFRNDIFDVSISIAVLHHISTLESRLNIISELIRITKPNGKILVNFYTSIKQKLCAWSLEQDDEKSIHKFNTQDNLVQWKLQKQYSKDGKDKVLYRYCHVYKEGEIEGLFKKFENIKIEKSFQEHGNWYILVKKIK